MHSYLGSTQSIVLLNLYLRFPGYRCVLKFAMAQNNNNSETVISYPPESLWGNKTVGSTGNRDGIHYRVAAVTLTTDTALNTIAFTYQEEDGSNKVYPPFGSVKGANVYNITFLKDETLVGISGYTGTVDSNLRVISVTFYTNLGKHGPFGNEDVEGAQSFECRPTGGCEIAGFYGRTDKFVNSLGLHVRLTMQACDPNEASSVKSAVTSAMKSAAIILKDENWTPLPSLSWGGEGGYPWDEGTFKGIKQIKVKYDNKAICTIQTQYVGIEGDTVQGAEQGDGSTPAQTAVIDLNYPDEYLMSVSGTIGQRGPWGKGVRSLKFITNLKVYGPYGDIFGESFSSPESGCKIIGFYGMSGTVLDHIGVHLLTNQPNPDEKSGWEEFGPAKVLATLLKMKT